MNAITPLLLAMVLDVTVRSSRTHFRNERLESVTSQACVLSAAPSGPLLSLLTCGTCTLFKVSFPWWRHLLSFFNLVLRFAVVESSHQALLLTPIVYFSRLLRLLDFRAPALCSHRAPHPATTRPFPKRLPLACRWPSALVDTLRLCRHEHTFAAFIDIKKAFDSCWVEATLGRLFDFGVSGRLWHSLANFLCGTLSQVRLGGSVSPPWVDSGFVQGRILFSPSVQSARRQSCHHTPFCHSRLSLSSLLTPFVVYANFMQTIWSFLTASQAEIQVALDAVHAWGVRLALLFWYRSFQIYRHDIWCTHWRRSFALGPGEQEPGCCSFSHSFLASTSILSAGQCRCLGEGLPLSFSSSVFVINVLSSSSLGLELICIDLPALQQFNLALVATSSDGPTLPLLLQCTGNWHW